MAELLAHDGWTHQQSAESLAVFGSDLNVQGTPSLPNISVANFFTLANAISGPLAGDNIYGLRDVFSTTQGTAHDQCRRRNLSGEGPSGNAAE